MKLHPDVTNKKSINSFKTLEKRCNKIHNNFYNYSEFIFKKNNISSTIICPIHGKFEQKMNNHLSGQGCYKCSLLSRSKKRRSSIEDILNKANEVHNYKYDYSKFEYINTNTKSIIICPEHGEWETIMQTHIKGTGCPKCGLIKMANSRRYNLEYLIEKANTIHNHKYSYSHFKYTGVHDKSTIVCSEHGGFNMSMSAHLTDRSGCPKCSKQSSDNDCLYIWKIKNTDIYKIGVTSYRLRHKRIKRVAREHKVEYEVIFFKNIKNAENTEKIIHKKYNRPQELIKSGDGHTEFKTLYDHEIKEIISNIK